MTAVQASAVAAAPPERVFAVATNLANLPNVVSGIDAVEVLTGGPVGEGTRWRETRTVHGRRATEEMWIAGFDPPRSFVVEAKSHGAHYRTACSFAPEGLGTRVTLEFTGRPLTLFARLFSVLGRIMAGSLRRMLEKDLREIGRAAEG